MKKIIITQIMLLGTFINLIVLPAPAAALGIDAGPLKIIEVQPASLASASEEYVIIYNNTYHLQTLEGWEVQYKSATGSSWVTKAKLHGLLSGWTEYVLATADNTVVSSNANLQTGMASSGGHVRIVYKYEDGQLGISDLIGWGLADQAEGQAALAPEAGDILIRNSTEDNHPIDTDDNSTDFMLHTPNDTETTDSEGGAGNSDTQPDPNTEVPSDLETPPTEDAEPPVGGSGDNEAGSDVTEDNPTTVPEVPSTTDEDPTAAPTDQSEVVPVAPRSLQITEMLPNPAMPDIDSQAEYIELFNPNSVAVSLDGYVLVSGSNLTYRAELEGQIESGAYRVFTAAQYRISLANSGGKAQLWYGDTLIDEAAGYANAKDGLSWTLVDGVWQWSSAATPATTNVFTAPPAAASKTKAATATKKAAVKAVATKKSTSKSTPQVKTASAKTSNTDSESDGDAPAKTNANTLLLAGIGSVALLYALYEYRHDLANNFKKFRYYRANRRDRRQGLTGRRNNSVA